MDTTAYKTTVAREFGRAAATYDRLGVRFFTPMGAELVERVAPREGEHVLDVGCGLGACLFPAAERVGPSGSVLGIDIAPEMVAEASRAAAERGAGTVEVRVMDAEYPDLPDRAFDVVTGSYSVIFLPDAPAALPRYAALLATGGRLGFTSPVFSDDTFPFLPPLFTPLIPRRLLRTLPPEWAPEELSRRFNRWLADPDTLERTVRKAGFTDVRVEDVVIDMVAGSGTEWVDWSHTQGMRLLWNHLPAEESTRLREHLVRELDAMRDGESPLHVDTPVRYVTATVDERA